ncbi:MAG: NAD-binding protein [Thermoplasmata archaeon]|nr:MAG: NAD-binding protein [Thermoplasmata archaeon]
MHVVIGGAGDAGQHLGMLLRAEGHEVAFVENNESAAARASNIDALVIKGDVSDPDSLKDAGIEKSDYYLGVTKDDSANLTSCSLANYYGCGTIARVNDPFLANEAVSRRYVHIGVDVVLCPPLITAAQISRVFSFPSSLRELRKRNMKTYHMVVEFRSPCRRKQISQLDLPTGSRIISVFRGVEQIIPLDPTVLQEEDELCILLDNRAKVEDVKKALGTGINPYKEVKDVFIAGATNTGLTLAQKLLDSDISVVIMEISKKKTEDVARTLPRASVIQSDPLGHGVLKKEEIGRFDVMLATGFGMERNLLIAVLAKQFGVPTALALVDRIDLKASVEKTLVDDVVVPNLLLVKTIMNLLRGGDPLRRKILRSEDILLKNTKVIRKMRCVGKAVGELSSAIGTVLIAGAVREGDAFIPEDNHMISEGERLFLLYYPTDRMAIDRWFSG